MIKKINLVINSAIEILIKNKRKKEELLDENQRILEYESEETDEETEQEIENATYKKNPKKGYDLKVYLQNSITGLRNLKETYATCSQTKARLDVIINKIEQNLKN